MQHGALKNADFGFRSYIDQPQNVNPFVGGLYWNEKARLILRFYNEVFEQIWQVHSAHNSFVPIYSTNKRDFIVTLHPLHQQRGNWKWEIH